MHAFIKYIPNILTLLGAAFSFIAFYLALQGYIVLCIFLTLSSSIFDYLDGFIARCLNIESNSGIVMDSLSDLFSFGIIPVVVFILLFNAQSALEVLVLGIFVISSILRLSLFSGEKIDSLVEHAKDSNLKKQSEDAPLYFKGSPIVQSCLIFYSLLAGFYWLDKSGVALSTEDQKNIAMLVLLSLSFLMIYRKIKFYSLPRVAASLFGKLRHSYRVFSLLVILLLVLTSVTLLSYKYGFVHSIVYIILPFCISMQISCMLIAPITYCFIGKKR